MNYVILNDVKSTLIQGLLISELPPISKPLMRTTIEEVDGRDGDIVTKLGYSAYDKTMTIGLFGNYDIDQVIEYFDSEGTVIFSNEPDKFYRYQILEAIDFERLARFKTATVTFHVQPFKFSAIDDAFLVTKENLDMKIYNEFRDGITIHVENGIITASGTAYRNTEFYIPISLSLDARSYTMEASADGDYTDCKMRIINGTPTDAESFAHTEIDIASTMTLQETFTVKKSFNYIWLSFKDDTEYNFTLDCQVYTDNFDSFRLFNRGNTVSKPIFTLYGVGNISFKINGVIYFTIALGSLGYITLDGIEMNAYKGNTLLNRIVAGDYKNLTLKVGVNTISWVGNITQVKVENVSRWI